MKVKFEDLSPWLKFAVVYTLVQFGITAAYFVLMAIIGIASLD